MTPIATAEQLRAILFELQRAGDVSPQLDIANLPLHSTMASVGLDSVARVGLAALIDERLGIWLDDNQVQEDTSLSDIVSRIAEARLSE